MNLYKETIEALTENGKTFDDVVAICGKEFQITKDDFLKYSDVEYIVVWNGADIINI